MYYLIYSLLYLISLLPFKVLYLLSDFCAFILHSVVKYRKEVIMGNLAIAFPEKTEKERKEITKEFYKRFSDNFIELIKLISLSAKEIEKRFVPDIATLQTLHNEGLSVDFTSGHYFNWEWANLSYSIQNPYTQLVVYSHITNGAMEKLMHKLRARFGVKLIDSYKFKEQYKPYADKQKMFVLVADQSPRALKSAFWIDYFGKKTAFSKGPETSARVANNAVVFCSIRRIKRGYYSSKLHILAKHARATEKGEITLKMVSAIEELIKQDPANYLWSHRRWKHSFNEAEHAKQVIERTMNEQ